MFIVDILLSLLVLSNSLKNQQHQIGVVGYKLRSPEYPKAHVSADCTIGVRTKRFVIECKCSMIDVV